MSHATKPNERERIQKLEVEAQKAIQIAKTDSKRKALEYVNNKEGLLDYMRINYQGDLNSMQMQF